MLFTHITNTLKGCKPSIQLKVTVIVALMVELYDDASSLGAALSSASEIVSDDYPTGVYTTENTIKAHTLISNDSKIKYFFEKRFSLRCISQYY